MKARLLVALAAGFLVGSNPAPDLGEVQSQEIPPGSKWVWTGFDGLPRVDEFNKDGVWQTVFPPRFLPESYTLNPPRIDTTCGRRHRHGIYWLEGDRLLICMGDYGAGARPTTFTHRPQAGQYLYVLKRLKGPPAALAMKGTAWGGDSHVQQGMDIAVVGEHGSAGGVGKRTSRYRGQGPRHQDAAGVMGRECLAFGGVPQTAARSSMSSTKTASQEQCRQR